MVSQLLSCKNKILGVFMHQSCAYLSQTWLLKVVSVYCGPIKHSIIKCNVFVFMNASYSIKRNIHVLFVIL